MFIIWKLKYYMYVVIGFLVMGTIMYIAAGFDMLPNKDKRFYDHFEKKWVIREHYGTGQPPEMPYQTPRVIPTPD